MEPGVVPADRLEQHVGADHVGPDERLGVVEGVVVVRLGREVDHGVVGGHERLDGGGVGDVADDQLDPVGREVGQRLGARGVGQLVEDGDPGVGVLDHVPDEVGADEAGAAGDEQMVHGGDPRRRRCGPSRRRCSVRCPHARNHPGGRHRIAPPPDHACGEQAAGAGLRQADDLLPALDADARRDPRGAGDHDAARAGGLPPPAGRRLVVRRGDLLRRPALTRRARPGLPDRRGAPRRRGGRPGAGRQHLLRAGTRHPPAPVRPHRRCRRSSATGWPTRRRTAW